MSEEAHPAESSTPQSEDFAPLDTPIDLDNVSDRFKVVEYFLQLQNRPLFDSDRHPAALYVAEIMAEFAESKVQQLMGLTQNVAEPTAESKGDPSDRFTDSEVDVLKSLVAELQKPTAQPQPQRRQEVQTVPPAEREQPPRRVVQPTHIPGRRVTPQVTPMVGTVRRGPNSRPTLSIPEMEATTAIQSKIAGERGFRNFSNLKSSGTSRDHTEEREE